MNKSQIHCIKSNVNKRKKNKCITKNDDVSENNMIKSDKKFEHYDNSNQTENLYQKIKYIDTKIKSISSKSISKNKNTSEFNKKSTKRNKVGNKIGNKENICKKGKSKINKASIKEAFNSIHDIESDAENDNVKIAKKKLSDREAELKRKQLPNVPASKAFRPSDIQRIVQHTTTSIFDKEKCSLWTGYITNLQNRKKGTYVNFYFKNKKKVALHRLLYANFKGDIGAQDYIKYSCPNKGKCCNINHIVKFEYNDDDDCENEDKIDDQKSKNNGKSKNSRGSRFNKSKSNKSSITKDNFKINIY